MNYSNRIQCNFEHMAFLYQGPLFNQSGWLLSPISYLIYSLVQIIHDKPTWCNIALNTNLEIISSNVIIHKYKPVSFLQLIHLIATTPTLSISLIKWNSNMAETFNSEVISPCFGFIIFSVCSIMARKGSHWIIYFI